MAIRAATCSHPTARGARGLGAVLAAAALLLARPATAESPVSIPDPVAQALFQDGRDLVDRGEWAAGCTKFEASMLLYPAASTLLNIARCREHEKKLASAWSAYKRAQVLNRETLGEERKRAIDELIGAQIAALTPRLPKIELVMTRPVLGVTIRKDGEVMPAAVLGTEVPVDVGEHEVTAEAPGHVPYRLRFDMAEGATRRITIDLVSEADAAREGSVGVPAWAWATGGASLVFLGVSAGFRIDQAYVEGQQNGRCDGDVLTRCPPGYDPSRDNTRKNVDFALSLGFGVAGAAALAASIIGIVRGTRPPRAPKAAIMITREGGALSATFHF